MGRDRSQDVRERPDVAVVVAARAGDPEALEHLVRACLPLVYNIVGRALDGHSDVDDVVQDTMLRALDGLSGLEEPERFRSWLVAIAVRQVRDRWRGRQVRPQADLPDEAVQETAPEADFADLAILRLALSGQRREAVEATRWLEDEEREVLSLWWLEAAGELTRAELAAACELAPQHAAVRVQRVKERLESGRAVVRALAASPRCAELEAQLASWDGRPNARWRKRLARHVRDCPQCLFNTSELVPAEGLLGGFALVPVPIGLAGLLLAKSMPSASAAGGTAHAPDSAGRVAHVLGRLATKPVATLTAGAVVLAGAGALYAYTRSDAPVRPPAAQAQVQAPTSSATPSSPPTPTTSATPTSTAASTLLGRHALRSVDQSGRYVREVGNLGFLSPVAATSPEPAKQEATFRFVTGLADSHCYSIEDASGRYLRHYAFRIQLDANDGSAVFRKDATFCARPGSTDGSVSLESYNYPGRYLRYRDNLELWVDPAQNTTAFRASRSFTVVAPWT
ncbi:sigma-70 family RNA polymerase sigma factor [Streptomyces sp. NBC_00554]|uniref:sigma-70 family RNA polymerase sigma factor n=1 Tax=unclassified Streptomyces TaxID=2593676 RepID=UPI00225BE365|nr:sigma-70 family RNA polymerase sigma factor [Streptomyces sp. NBC_00620]MCX4977065.1 sigma-70 family RNA polymerase sigma factor [Streptomyces sp. NBC_00620]WUC54696.1 sigma-70 family RNA polymerase sigma factor [Streptomyces sp. NBC_00554]